MLSLTISSTPPCANSDGAGNCGRENMENNSLKLQLNPSTELTVNLFGATITSWICDGQEQLFLSDKAIFDCKKALRGGIPVVFPHFGPWEKGPQHGFARITQWSVHRSPQVASSGAAAEVVLKLEETEHTRAMWSHRFRLLYRIDLMSTSLRCQLSVENTDEQPFDFTCLLHTYFLLPDVSDLAIYGLNGLAYIDKVKKGTYTEDREVVTVAESVDRVYQRSPDRHIIQAKGHRSWDLIKENMPDTVLWNPWIENAKAMADFGDDEYLRMVCVEPGCVSAPVALEPGATFECAQTLVAHTSSHGAAPLQ